jgi:hypothetical protein
LPSTGSVLPRRSAKPCTRREEVWVKLWGGPTEPGGAVSTTRSRRPATVSAMTNARGWTIFAGFIVSAATCDRGSHICKILDITKRDSCAAILRPFESASVGPALGAVQAMLAGWCLAPPLKKRDWMSAASDGWRRCACRSRRPVRFASVRFAATKIGGPGLATSTTGQSGAENAFALSVARLVESLPLSTPPGRNVAHFTRPDHAAGFARPPSALVKGLRLGRAAIGVKQSQAQPVASQPRRPRQRPFRYRSRDRRGGLA